MSGLVGACLLVGALHGFVLAALLWRRQQNERANRYLAGLLGALALLLVDGYLEESGVHDAYPHSVGLTAALPFLFGPLLYLHVRAMTWPGPSSTLPAARRHFVVACVYVVLLAPTFYFRSASYKTVFLAAVRTGESPWYVELTDLAKFIHGFAYLVAALLCLRAHRKRITSFYANLEQVRLRWLVTLVALNAAVWSFAVAFFLLLLTGASTSIRGSEVGAVALASTIAVFVIGYFQLAQAELFDPKNAGVALTPTPSSDVPTASALAPPPTSYHRARLADDDSRELEARLITAMTQRHVYARSGLTLGELAAEIGATAHELSQVLSTRIGRNFYTYVNDHRIERVKEALRSPSSRDRSVLDLALEAGFASKSTFNAAFRRATGLTPREYRQQAGGGQPREDT